ncbi:MAG: cysteine hydrolase family protein [Nocardioidaceae bacterium]
MLIIDMLNDFLHPEGKTPTRAGRKIDHARAVIPAQQELLDAARGAGARVVCVNPTPLPDYASASGPWLEARSRATYSVEDICLAGTWGGEVIDELTPTDGDLAVAKYRYSGFAGTNLDLVLRSAGVRTVVCAGVSTNACVEATAREAFSLDYYVVYAKDACASWDMALHEATLATAAHRYAQVCDTAELAKVWRG